MRSTKTVCSSRMALWAGMLAGMLAHSCSGEVGRLPTGPDEDPGVSPTEEQLLSVEQSVRLLDETLHFAQQVIVIPLPGGSITIGFENDFYIVEAVMFGSIRKLRLQFRDAAGRPMPVYDPALTTTVALITQQEDRNGFLRFQLVLGGVNAASPTIAITGNAVYENNGPIWRIFFNRITLAKVGNPYPVGGNLVVGVDHDEDSETSVRFDFNGTRYVHGTLISGSVTVFFTVDLVRGTFELSESPP